MEMQRKGTLVACVLSRQPPPTKPAPMMEVSRSPSLLQTMATSGAGREKRENPGLQVANAAFQGVGTGIGVVVSGALRGASCVTLRGREGVTRNLGWVDVQEGVQETPPCTLGAQGQGKEPKPRLSPRSAAVDSSAAGSLGVTPAIPVLAPAPAKTQLHTRRSQLAVVWNGTGPAEHPRGPFQQNEGAGGGSAAQTPGGAGSPPKKRREDMMEPIQLTCSEEPPTSSWKATKKIPKVLSIPMTSTLT